MKRLFSLNLMLLALVAACVNHSSPLIASTIDTSLFDGDYSLILDSSFGELRNAIAEAKDGNTKQTLESLLAFETDQFSNLTISNGMIRSGSSLVQEFSILEATIRDNQLKGRAIWHEDVGDPGDMSELFVELDLEDNILYLYFYETPDDRGNPIVLAKMP